MTARSTLAGLTAAVVLIWTAAADASRPYEPVGKIEFQPIDITTKPADRFQAEPHNELCETPEGVIMWLNRLPDENWEIIEATGPGGFVICRKL